MPNHVYTCISVEKKYAEKLKTIIKNGGICQYYKPMPKALEIMSGSYGSHPDNKEKAEELARLQNANLKNFGYQDWYDFSVEEWGTKWGEYEQNEEESDTRLDYTYNTAWSPLNAELITMLSRDIPDFSYTWEEEQGFGEEWECKNGQMILIKEWSAPEWEEVITDGDKGHYPITYLKQDYENLEGKFKSGYYESWNLGEYLGDTLEEAKEEYEINHG